jgi:hypothetical protein
VPAFAAADAAYARQAAAPGADAYVADARTSLGVVGVLRRVQLLPEESAEEGEVLLVKKDIMRWAKIILA